MGYQIHKIRLANTCYKESKKQDKDSVPSSYLIDAILLRCKPFIEKVFHQQGRGVNADNEVFVERNNVIFRDELDAFINKQPLTSKYHSQLMLTHDDLHVIMFEQHHTKKDKQGQTVKYVSRYTLFSVDHYEELKAAALAESEFLYKILDTKEVE